jgi:hypothetical protein
VACARHPELNIRTDDGLGPRAPQPELAHVGVADRGLVESRGGVGDARPHSLFAKGDFLRNAQRQRAPRVAAHDRTRSASDVHVHVYIARMTVDRATELKLGQGETSRRVVLCRRGPGRSETQRLLRARLARDG